MPLQRSPRRRRPGHPPQRFRGFARAARLARVARAGRLSHLIAVLQARDPSTDLHPPASIARSARPEGLMPPLWTPGSLGVLSALRLAAFADHRANHAHRCRELTLSQAKHCHRLPFRAQTGQTTAHPTAAASASSSSPDHRRGVNERPTAFKGHDGDSTCAT